MRITEKLLAVSLLALFAGCTTLSELNPFSAKESKNQPAALPQFKTSLMAHAIWTSQIGKAGVYAFTPALAENSLFVAAADGALARIDAVTGRDLWRIKTGLDLSAGVGSDGAFVAVGAAKGVLLVYDGAGKALWRAQASSEILSVPVVGQGLVVMRSVDNRITAFDARSGVQKWSVLRTLPALTLRNAPGLVISGANVIVAQAGGKLLALTLASGLPRWEAVLGEPRGATELERVTDIANTPVLFEKDVCAVSYQGRVGCYDAASGAARWSKELSSSVGVAVDQRFVFTADEKGAVAAFSREGGQSAWKNDKLAYRGLSSPLSYGRAVVVGDYQGFIHFLSREDGAFIGRVSTDGSPIISVPVIAGTNLIFQSQSGTVTALAVE